MKNIKFLLFFFVILFTNIVYAQVGVGTNAPHASAALDMDVSNLASKKGFLLPRVNLTHNKDITTITNPAAGLIVFNLQDSMLNGNATTAVFKDMFYFWNGVQWIDIATLDVVKRELFPQVFFIVGKQNQSTSTVSAAPIVVNWQTDTTGSSVIHLNSGNNITLNSDNTFTVNKTGQYEVSGSITMNPNVDLSSSANLEFTIQYSTDGTNWTDIGKNTAVWGQQTGGNSQTIIISPMVVNVAKDAKIRCTVYSTVGTHGSGSKIYIGTGMTYSRSLRIQYLN